jgi:hypothetical protein
MQLERTTSGRTTALSPRVEVRARTPLDAASVAHLKRHIAARSRAIFGASFDDVSMLVVSVRHPMAEGYPCRVTARMEDGREQWCTASDDHVPVAAERALRELAEVIARDGRARRGRRLRVALAAMASVTVVGAIAVAMGLLGSPLSLKALSSTKASTSQTTVGASAQ